MSPISRSPGLKRRDWNKFHNSGDNHITNLSFCTAFASFCTVISVLSAKTCFGNLTPSQENR